MPMHEKENSGIASAEGGRATPPRQSRQKVEFMKTLFASSAATLVLCAPLPSTAATRPDTPQLSVQYDNSFQGISALQAVRACVQPEQNLVVERREPRVSHAVFLRLLDGHGAEVARFSGSKGVCTFARFAAEYMQVVAGSAPEGPDTTTSPADPPDATPN